MIEKPRTSRMQVLEGRIEQLNSVIGELRALRKSLELEMGAEICPFTVGSRVTDGVVSYRVIRVTVILGGGTTRWAAECVGPESTIVLRGVSCRYDGPFEVTTC